MKEEIIQALLQQHRAAIDTLWAQCEEFKGKDIGVPLDDIFLLRFVLSNKNDLQLAGKKLRETLQWRMDNIDKLNSVVMGKLPYRMEVTKYIKGGLCGWFGDSLFFAIRVGLADLPALMRELSANQVSEFLIMTNEIHFRMVDEKTRSTGVLCKMITIIDAHGFSLSRFSRKFMTALGTSSHVSNKYFPQLLRHTVFINLPSTVKMLFNAFKLLLPASAVDKQRVCMGKPYSGQSAADCPFLKSKMKDSAASIATLPSFLGGEAKAPESLQHDEDM